MSLKTISLSQSFSHPHTLTCSSPILHLSTITTIRQNNIDITVFSSHPQKHRRKRNLNPWIMSIPICLRVSARSWGLLTVCFAERKVKFMGSSMNTASHRERMFWTKRNPVTLYLSVSQPVVREHNISNGGKHQKAVKIKTQKQSCEVLFYKERLMWKLSLDPPTTSHIIILTVLILKYIVKCKIKNKGL
jgi:hypothetical protein